jgi:2-polyprenyl-6-methoxyphenol hydroxylase-like FAD-dependent oxidoreductase
MARFPTFSYKIACFALILWCIDIIYSVALAIDPIRKVAVIGAGVTGLTLASAIQRLCPNVEEVTICDSRTQPLQPETGGGLQMTGGATVLGRLSLEAELLSIAQPLHSVLCRNTRGDVLYNLDIKGLFAKANSVACVEPKYAVTIMRDALLSLLYNSTLSQADKKPIMGAKVNYFQGYECTQIQEHNDKVDIYFDNNQKVTDNDLVIGADGINSHVRQHLKCKLITGREVDTSNYSDIRIAFCVSSADATLRAGDDRAFHQYMGDGVYALSSSYGGLNGLHHMLAIVYQDSKQSVYGENIGWAVSSAGDSLSVLEDRLKAGRLHRVSEINHMLASIISTGRIFDLGVKDRFFPLDRWSSPSGRVLLAGDSAHPM